MTTETEKSLALRARETSEELDELSRRRDEALAQLRRSESRFDELEQQRTVLSPKAFSGDEEAIRELEKIEDEHERVARSSRVASSALPEFERMIEETKASLSEVQEQIYRARAKDTDEKLKTLSERREKLAGELDKVFKEYSATYHDLMQEVRNYSQDEANILARGARTLHRDFLREAFSEWL